jgi:thiopurine S-methyltransferase
MKPEFWQKSWNLGGFYTSFHRKDVHPFILKYLQEKELKDKTILVPLCGKTLDILDHSKYARKVIGVEIVEEAVVQFFEENNLDYERVDNTTYQSGNIMIFVRDFFSLQLEDIGGAVDWVNDRASLVALPPDMRIPYLETIDRVTDTGSKILLNTLEYYPRLDSAPFSIGYELLEEYFGAVFKIEILEKELQNQHGMVRRWGLNYLYEQLFILTKYTNDIMMEGGKTEFSTELKNDRFIIRDEYKSFV